MKGDFSRFRATSEQGASSMRRVALVAVVIITGLGYVAYRLFTGSPGTGKTMADEAEEPALDAEKPEKKRDIPGLLAETEVDDEGEFS
jgi:hypothetical protein